MRDLPRDGVSVLPPESELQDDLVPEVGEPDGSARLLGRQEGGRGQPVDEAVHGGGLEGPKGILPGTGILQSGWIVGRKRIRGWIRMRLTLPSKIVEKKSGPIKKLDDCSVTNEFDVITDGSPSASGKRKLRTATRDSSGIGPALGGLEEEDAALLLLLPDVRME